MITPPLEPGKRYPVFSYHYGGPHAQVVSKGWQGALAQAIVDKLNKEISAGLADPKMKARLAELGGSVFVGSPADFGRLIAAETEKWAKVIRAANIKAEG